MFSIYAKCVVLLMKVRARIIRTITKVQAYCLAAFYL